ncbi:MAG: phosphatase PAP2 family protein [Clostridia bacterium]|nr:phosphatase PAP2 family protein [Clostridia bacterium]
MRVLYFFESIRNPFLDAFMSLITRLGEETVFIALAILVFWCVDKTKGYFLITVGFLGTVINQFLKVLFRIPRPWVKDPNFTIVESAREAATGYSFPSGHTQSAVGSFGALARTTKKNWLRIVCLVIVGLVPISRMYLGVHTLLDVGVSFLIATALVLGLYPLIKLSDKKPCIIPIILASSSAIALLSYIFIKVYPFPADADMENITHGAESVVKLLGASIGVLVSYFIEKKYIKFETNGHILTQIIKVVIGLAILVGIKSLIKTPLNFVLGVDLGNAVRYFILIIFAVLVWPLAFKPIDNFIKKLLKK